MQRVTIVCHRCKGSGTIPLPAEMAETLGHVRAGARTAEEIHKLDSQRDFILSTAINMRLMRLHLLGLVARKQEGRTFIYTPTRKGTHVRSRTKTRKRSG